MLVLDTLPYMPEYNEEIARRFFETQGYFVRSNVPYKFSPESGGAGWSDVDLCILHPLSGDAAAVEVKGWHTEAIGPGHLRAWPNLFHFTRPEATAAVHTLIGVRDFRRILIVGRISDRGREEVVATASSRGVELLEFKDILNVLVSGTHRGRTAESGYEHIVRVLDAYGYLAVPEADV